MTDESATWAQRDEPSDLAQWFPVVKAAGLPVPQTEIITAPDGLLSLLDGQEPPGFGDFLAEIRRAVHAVGGYPAFLRTGLLSAKHDWLNTCYLANGDRLAQHVYNLVEASELADVIGLPARTWAVRAMLPTRPAFTAFSGALPITREYRLFVSDGQVIHEQPYWLEDAIEQSLQEPSVPDWRARLAALNALSPDDLATVRSLAERAGAALPGYWSVDLVQVDDARGWVLIDMAEGLLSFMYEPGSGRSLDPGDRLREVRGG